MSFESYEKEPALQKMLSDLIDKKAEKEQLALETKDENKETKIEHSEPTMVQPEVPEVKESPIENITANSIESLGQDPTSTPFKEETWEEKAQALGWDATKTGDFAVSAREYVLRQPLFDRLEKQNALIEELKQKQDFHDKHLAQVAKDSYEQALRELGSQRDSAIQNADLSQVKQLELRMGEIQRKIQSDPIINRPAQPQLSQTEIALNSFKSRNPWYGDTSNSLHLKMTLAAQASDKFKYIEDQKKGLSIDPDSHMRFIESEMQKLFPGKFKNSETTKPVTPNSTSTAPITKVSTDYISQLTPEQRAIGLEFQKYDAKYSLEKYAKDLARDGILGKNHKTHNYK